MKNIFKFLGIALMASALMVACEKDPSTPSDTTPDTPEQPATPTVTVTFGSINWTPAVAQIFTGNYANFGVNEYILYREAQAYPFVDLLISGQPGTYQHEATLGTNTEGGYTYYAWQTGQSVSEQYLPLYSINYYESQVLGTQESPMGDWQPVSASLTVTAYDANTLTATFTLTATMYDYYSWAADLVTNAEDAETQALEVKATNYTFTEISK